MAKFRQFDLAIEALMGLMIDLSAQVEAMVDLGLAALTGPESPVLANARANVDEACVNLEKRCNDLLALQSPRAGDLRLLIATTRVALDLQRMTELSIDIARRAKPWRESALATPEPLVALTEMAQDMLHRAAAAFIHADVEQARQVIAQASAADHRARDSFAACQALLATTPGNAAGFAHLMRTVGHIEHLIDLTIDIAEEAVYVHTGVFARHAAVAEGSGG
jgi:phosphate transport system protein